MRFFSWHHGNDWTKFERHVPPLHESMFSNAMFMDHLKSCVPQVQCLTLEHASELPGVLLKHRRMILGWGLKCEFAERFQVMLVRLVWRTHLQSHCPHYIISHFRNNLVGEVWQVQTRNDCKPQPGTDLLLSVVDISLSRATGQTQQDGILGAVILSGITHFLYEKTWITISGRERTNKCFLTLVKPFHNSTLGAEEQVGERWNYFLNLTSPRAY